MSQTDLSLLISAIGLVLSVLASVTVVAFRSGKLVQKLEDINSRLARIEALFQLTLRGGKNDS
jgi:hypothetical protein